MSTGESTQKTLMNDNIRREGSKTGTTFLSEIEPEVTSQGGGGLSKNIRASEKRIIVKGREEKSGRKGANFYSLFYHY